VPFYCHPASGWAAAVTEIAVVFKQRAVPALHPRT